MIQFRQLRKYSLYFITTWLSESAILKKKTFFMNPFYNSIFGLDDDDLFAACGGRTAHRAAKYGLKLGGKLARLEKQESLKKVKKEA